MIEYICTYVSHVLLVNTIVEKFIKLMADNEVRTAIQLPTLAAEMFGGRDFWLEIRVIIILDIQEPLTDFNGNEAKKIKMANSKN